MVHFGDLQNQIYLQGLGGEHPALPLTYRGLEDAARQRMSAEGFAYVAGGASSERTMAANLEAFARWRIVPRMLRGVVERDLTTTLFEREFAAPVLAGPVGALGLVHDDPDRAVVRAAAGLGLPSVLSTVASTSMEDVAAAAPDANRWFQLYWPSDVELAESFVRRAEAAGNSAIMVTLDTWQLGWRPRDIELAHLPFLRGTGLANFLTDPVFADRCGGSTDDLQTAVLTWVRLFGNPALRWSELALLRDWTDLPVVVKGVCHPEDARLALDAGVDGVVVSNHGGRQVDGARGALDCLPDVLTAVDGRVPVLVDSGIRCGADIHIALALGAAAVLVARPWVYGLALAGEEGVRHVLATLLADLDINLALSGHGRPGDLTTESVVREVPTG